MQPNPLYKQSDAGFVRDLAVSHPWATLVSQTPSGFVASQTPVMLDDAVGSQDGDTITLVTHLGRADARLHGLVGGAATGTGTMLVVLQGEHDYISPTWYLGADRGEVPTWNFESAHVECAVQVMSDEENIATLAKLVEHFEGDRPGAVRLDVTNPENRGLAMGTTGLRLVATSFVAKSKLSQNKSRETRESVIRHLRDIQPALAKRMALALESETDSP